MKKVYTLYRASHKKAGSYIGCTSMSLTNRKYSHHSAANGTSTMPFHKALRHYTVGWEWEVLDVATSKEEADAKEAALIAEHSPNLNIRLGGNGGGKLPEWFTNHGGYKNRGRKASESTRAWFREFHSTRPRKRQHDRSKMLQLYSEGKSVKEISKSMGCDYALVYRVVNGIYKP